MKKIVVVALCTMFGCFMFAGCSQNNSITFKRDSKFGELMDNLQGSKPVVKKSSGLVIYQDGSNKKQSQSSGSSDIRFDMPIKF